MCRDFFRDHCNSTFWTSFLGWNLAVNISSSDDEIHQNPYSYEQGRLCKCQMTSAQPKTPNPRCSQKKISLVPSSGNNWNDVQHLQLLLKVKLSPNSGRRGSVLVLSKSAGVGSWTKYSSSFSVCSSLSIACIHNCCLLCSKQEYLQQNTTSHILQYINLKFKSNHLIIFQ